MLFLKASVSLISNPSLRQKVCSANELRPTRAGYLPIIVPRMGNHLRALPFSVIKGNTLRYARSNRGATTAFAGCPWLAVAQSQTIKSAVTKATEILSQCMVPEAAESAEYLAISSFHDIRTRPDARRAVKRPNHADLERFVNLCKQRQQKRTPIQYLVGNWDFHHITLLVRAPVLIPRPETEELVEHLLKNTPGEKAKILDVGCGSGAILLAALSFKREWTAVGIDISEEAIQLTHDNLKLLHLEDRASILRGTIEHLCGKFMFDAIVSNPPYIPKAEIDKLEAEVKDHEDIRALCGGEDGLDIVREILEWAPQILKPGGSIWMEVDTQHPSILESMHFEQIEYVKTLKDLCGRRRFCHFKRSVAEKQIH